MPLSETHQNLSTNIKRKFPNNLRSECLENILSKYFYSSSKYFWMPQGVVAELWPSDHRGFPPERKVPS